MRYASEQANEGVGGLVTMSRFLVDLGLSGMERMKIRSLWYSLTWMWACFIDLSILMPGLKPSDYPVNNINDIRVSALGVDSFSLIGALQEMKLNPYIQINGATGKLTLGNDCNIETQYSWGQVRSGQIIKQ